MSRFVTFDNNQLTSVQGLRILSTDPYKVPKRKLSVSSIARSNKAKVSSAFYEQRNIVVRVGISRSTREQAEQSLDGLMNVVQGKEKTMTLQQGSSERQYTCTFSEAEFIVSGGSYIELDLVFVCSDAFGYDMNYTTVLSLVNVTSSTRSDNYTFQGSASSQAPYISIYYSALTGGTAKSVTIGNNDNGQAVTITRDWSAGDRLIVDVRNAIVTVNDVEVDFNGALPEFATGLGTITYSDNFTTRTYSNTTYYYKRYV